MEYYLRCVAQKIFFLSPSSGEGGEESFIQNYLHSILDVTGKTRVHLGTSLVALWGSRGMEFWLLSDNEGGERTKPQHAHPFQLDPWAPTPPLNYKGLQGDGPVMSLWAGSTLRVLGISVPWLLEFIS